MNLYKLIFFFALTSTLLTYRKLQEKSNKNEECKIRGVKSGKKLDFSFLLFSLDFLFKYTSNNNTDDKYCNCKKKKKKKKNHLFFHFFFLELLERHDFNSSVSGKFVSLLPFLLFFCSTCVIR